MSGEKCIRQVSHPEIKIGDCGMSANFMNPSRAAYRLYDVDGCLVKNATAADKAVELIGTGVVVVEFKSRHVEGALKQVAATTQYFRKDRNYAGKLASLIVSRQCPLGAASINRHRNKFAKDHGGAILHVSSSAKSFVAEALLKSAKAA
ncbi:hypothetical protein [uncultured Brevundimonas sp.]|uniref:hypothetical protein n=1 Tax=uncultured Brevundimonas sp. TaxID=213418 RepID=UPI0025E05103|nr:hypothetical protein [uncultured Brevundimonas sp.]